MEFVFTLCLPRDASSVPVVRHMISGTMRNLGIQDGCVEDVEVAVTEACTNVLKHATGVDNQYEVEVELTESEVGIRITDTGGGFDHGAVGGAGVEPTDEGGRGILLMRALVDDLQFHSKPEAGTIVHLRKSLTLAEDSILLRLQSGLSGRVSLASPPADGGTASAGAHG